MECDAKTFFGVINAFRSLNLFSLLPLSRQEYMVMFVIAGQRKTNPEGSTVSMVTQKMHVPQPAVSRTLRGLENYGYICREVCRTDRRNTYVTLTAAGEAEVQRANQLLEDFHRGDSETLYTGRSRPADGTASAALCGGLRGTGGNERRESDQWVNFSKI